MISTTPSCRTTKAQAKWSPREKSTLELTISDEPATRAGENLESADMEHVSRPEHAPETVSELNQTEAGCDLYDAQVTRGCLKLIHCQHGTEEGV